MNIEAYTSSGILENYCVGLCSTEEDIVIEENAAQFQEIKMEVEKIRFTLEDYFLLNSIAPPPTVKANLMLSIYKQMAIENTEYAPLLAEGMDIALIDAWLADKGITNPTIAFENLHVTELASAEQVTNLMVYAKSGHNTEMHANFIEYLYIIKGSCIMDFEGVKKTYNKGDIITINSHINHSAIVTSIEPMVALVQRQACA